MECACCLLLCPRLPARLPASFAQFLPHSSPTGCCFALARLPDSSTHPHLAPRPSPPRRANNTGGANGSVRLELAGLSRGMQQAGALCAAWRTAINARLATDRQVPRGTAISFADVFQLAGAAAVIVTGGPSTAALWDALPVGRVDSTAASVTAAAPAAPADNVAALPIDTLDFTRLACIFGEHGCAGWGCSALPAWRQAARLPSTARLPLPAAHAPTLSLLLLLLPPPLPLSCLQ